MTSRKVCLVTGCAGFIGGHLSLRLLKLGYTVIGIDNFSSGTRGSLEKLTAIPSFHLVESDFTSPGLFEHLDRIFGPFSAVFHLAAIISIPYSMVHTAETMLVNHQGTTAFHDECREAGVPAFVFAGSAAEYGDCTRLPLREDYADESVSHLSPYGRSKWLASRHIEGAGYGCVLRFFNIYGPQQPSESPYSGVISLFANNALKGEPLTIHGSGNQARDFLYVDDAVDAYLVAAGLGGGLPLHGVYNVGTGEANYIYDVANIVLELTGGGEVCYLPPREGDICWSLADVSKLHDTGLFVPKVSIAVGLARTLSWLAQQDRAELK